MEKGVVWVEVKYCLCMGSTYGQVYVELKALNNTT
jgi:hypothetical protein